MDKYSSPIVVIRIDDIFMLDSEIEPSSILNFANTAEKHLAKLTLHTIPARLLQKTNNYKRMEKELRRHITFGHEITQHGYTHQCAICGSTGHEFDCSATGKIVAQDIQVAQIRKGRDLLTQVLGIHPRAFGPSGTDRYVPQMIAAMKQLRFPYHTDVGNHLPFIDRGIWAIPVQNDYCWALSKKKYRSVMNKAIDDFKRHAKQYGYFGILFHDHFTRIGYENGVVIHWLDEFLTKINQITDGNIRFMTLTEFGDWYRKRYPGKKNPYHPMKGNKTTLGA
ncbi:MAG: DUF2334 domain-containing protein [bacterium]|nr:DUF2334 domain-containing protein [bacterium]